MVCPVLITSGGEIWKKFNTSSQVDYWYIMTTRMECKAKEAKYMNSTKTLTTLNIQIYMHTYIIHTHTTIFGHYEFIQIFKFWFKKCVLRRTTTKCVFFTVLVMGKEYETK